MRAQTELLGSRTRVRKNYALIPLEGVPFSKLPEWPNAQVRILAAPRIGAEFAEYRIDLASNDHGAHAADGAIEFFFYVLEGRIELTVTDRDSAPVTNTLDRGGFALVPPRASFECSADEPTSILMLRKRYEPSAGIDLYAPLFGTEAQVPGETYLGDEGAKLQVLIPEELEYDLSMNIFTFETGHSLPVTETHVMEHGLYFLQGKGVYFLDDAWMETEESDFIWMGPFCPQSYYAAGPTSSKYLYYKNVNREIQL